MGAQVAVWQGHPAGRPVKGNPSAMKSAALRKRKIGTGAVTVYAAPQKQERAWRFF
jgi:hypothetical protein